MSDSAPKPALTPAEQLLLLQLQTRDAMARRRESSHRAAAEETDSLDVAGGQEPVDAVPSQWRLVPQGTTLHRWQSECLAIWIQQGRGTVKVVRLFNEGVTTGSEAQLLLVLERRGVVQGQQAS